MIRHAVVVRSRCSTSCIGVYANSPTSCIVNYRPTTVTPRCICSIPKDVWIGFIHDITVWSNMSSLCNKVFITLFVRTISSNSYLLSICRFIVFKIEPAPLLLPSFQACDFIRQETPYCPIIAWKCNKVIFSIRMKQLYIKKRAE